MTDPIRFLPGHDVVGDFDDRAEGARELIVAIFRLAVADYLGVVYDHDGPPTSRRVKAKRRKQAEVFLQSRWAAQLADLIGLSSGAIWSQARRQLERDESQSPPAAAA